MSKAMKLKEEGNRLVKSSRMGVSGVVSSCFWIAF